MEEAKRIFNFVVEGVDNCTDTILRMNDMYTVQLLLVEGVFKMEKDPEKRKLLIKSIRDMTNSFVSTITKIVSNQEMNTDILLQPTMEDVNGEQNDRRE